MKSKTIILTLAAASLFAGQVLAQTGDMTQAERNQKDSVETAERRDAIIENRQDEHRMADAKYDQQETKAKAKKAQRIENEANDAARESKSALRAERRAQKSRKQADKQAEKASDARDKSNRN